jgi:hypothetical protein
VSGRAAASRNDQVPGLAKVAFTVAVVTTVLALAVGQEAFSFVVSPIVIVAILIAMWMAPMRHSLMALMFCALTLENPEEGFAAHAWQSPLFPLGAAVLTHLNNTTGMRWMSFSGLDVMLIWLMIIWAYRRSSGSTMETGGAFPTPRPFIPLAVLSLVGTGVVWMIGMVRGGDFSISLWQLNKVTYLPIVFLLFSRALRGPRDFPALAQVLLWAAAIRAGLAYYIVQTVPESTPGAAPSELPYATSHHDSILFALAVVLVLTLVLERASRRALYLAAGLVPLLVIGIVSNNRRMAWVQIAIVFVTVYLATPMTPWKRKLNIAFLALTPLIVVYLVAGWNSTSPFFAGAHTVRSIVDPTTDASAQCREIENYDLITTIRAYPVIGSGYGIGYIPAVGLPPLGYDLEPYVPHNSILGSWAYCGYFGYTALTLLWGAGVYFGLRAYHASSRPVDRAAALMSFGAVIVYMVQCWGDMGLGSWTGVFTVAPALAVSGKLAVATGAWREKGLKRKAPRSPSREIQGPIGHPSTSPVRQPGDPGDAIPPPLALASRYHRPSS